MPKPPAIDNSIGQLKDLVRGIWCVTLSEGKMDTETGGWRVDLNGGGAFESETLEEAIYKAWLHHHMPCTEQQTEETK